MAQYQYDLSAPYSPIPRSGGGLLSGLAQGLGEVLDERNAAAAYAPLLDATYGAKPQEPSFLQRIFGMAQQPPQSTGGQAGALQPQQQAAGPGIGSDAVQGMRSLADLGTQAPMGRSTPTNIGTLGGQGQAGQYGMTASQAQTATQQPRSLADLGTPQQAQQPRYPREVIERLLAAGPEGRRMAMMLIPGGEQDWRRQQAEYDRASDERKFLADQQYRRDSLDIQRKGYEQGRVPPGYRPNGQGGYDYVPGGPYDPKNIEAQAGARGDGRAPQIETIYKDGREQKVVWNNEARGYVPIGDSKAPTLRPLPQTTVKALGDAGSSFVDMNRLYAGFDDNFAGQPLGFGELRNSIGRTFGGGPQQQAEWWQDYQTKKNITRNNLFGSALTATEKGEFEKADINPGMSPEVIRTNLARQASATLRAARKLADYYSKAGYPEDQIESAIGVPLADLRNAVDPLSTKDNGKVPQGSPQQRGNAGAGTGTAPRRGNDGNLYIEDPNRPGKYLMVQP